MFFSQLNSKCQKILMIVSFLKVACMCHIVWKNSVSISVSLCRDSIMIHDWENKKCCFYLRVLGILKEISRVIEWVFLLLKQSIVFRCFYFVITIFGDFAHLRKTKCDFDVFSHKRTNFMSISIWTITHSLCAIKSGALVLRSISAQLMWMF